MQSTLVEIFKSNSEVGIKPLMMQDDLADLTKPLSTNVTKGIKRRKRGGRLVLHRQKVGELKRLARISATVKERAHFNTKANELDKEFQRQQQLIQAKRAEEQRNRIKPTTAASSDEKQHRTPNTTLSIPEAYIKPLTIQDSCANLIKPISTNGTTDKEKRKRGGRLVQHRQKVGELRRLALISETAAERAYFKAKALELDEQFQRQQQLIRNQRAEEQPNAINSTKAASNDEKQHQTPHIILSIPEAHIKPLTIHENRNGLRPTLEETVKSKPGIKPLMIQEYRANLTCSLSINGSNGKEKRKRGGCRVLHRQKVGELRRLARISETVAERAHFKAKAKELDKEFQRQQQLIRDQGTKEQRCGINSKKAVSSDKQQH